MNAAAAVTVQHLVKRYGNLVAVNDISLSIHEGEIFGVIGPNGAGKTFETKNTTPATALATVYYSPSGAAARALLDSVFNGSPSYTALLTMAVYPIIFGFVAIRFFRWE